MAANVGCVFSKTVEDQATLSLKTNTFSLSVLSTHNPHSNYNAISYRWDWGLKSAAGKAIVTAWVSWFQGGKSLFLYCRLKLYWASPHASCLNYVMRYAGFGLCTSQTYSGVHPCTFFLFFSFFLLDFFVFLSLILFFPIHMMQEIILLKSKGCIRLELWWTYNSGLGQ